MTYVESGIWTEFRGGDEGKGWNGLALPCEVFERLGCHVSEGNRAVGN